MYKLLSRASQIGKSTFNEEAGGMPPVLCCEAEWNMGLIPPLLQSSSRSGGVKSPSELSPLLPAPFPLVQSLYGHFVTSC